MTTTTTTRERYDCPDWCERTDHDADHVGPGFPANHYGPEFGAVSTSSDGFWTGALVYLAGEASFVSDPAELRRVAADMVRAAEWLEAQA